jgi:hypothetical protein
VRLVVAVLGAAVLAGCTLTVTGPPPLVTSPATSADTSPGASQGTAPLAPGRRTAPESIRLDRLEAGGVTAVHTVVVGTQPGDTGGGPEPVVVGLEAGTSRPVRLEAVERLLRVGERVSLSPDGRQVALVAFTEQGPAPYEAHVITLETADDRRLDQPSDPQCPPSSVDFHPVDRLVAVQDGCGSLHLASPDTGRISRLWTAPERSGTTADTLIAWSPDGSVLAGTYLRPEPGADGEYATVLAGRNGKARPGLDLLRLALQPWGRDGAVLRGLSTLEDGAFVEVDVTTGRRAPVRLYDRAPSAVGLVGTNGAHLLGVDVDAEAREADGAVEIWTVGAGYETGRRWTRLVGATDVTSVETAGSPAVDPGD